MSGHRQRVIPKRTWAEGEWLGSYFGHPNDPRTDDTAEEEAEELEEKFRKMRNDMRLERERQEQKQ